MNGFVMFRAHKGLHKGTHHYSLQFAQDLWFPLCSQCHSFLSDSHMVFLRAFANLEPFPLVQQCSCYRRTTVGSVQTVATAPRSWMVGRSLIDFSLEVKY